VLIDESYQTYNQRKFSYVDFVTSEKAHGTCLYLRSVNQQGEVTTKLLCCKSRVAPVKKVTFPRLELCGALLLAQLIQKTVPPLNLKIDRILLWTDSTIVLSWLAANTQFFLYCRAYKKCNIQRQSVTRTIRTVKNNASACCTAGILDNRVMRKVIPFLCVACVFIKEVHMTNSYSCINSEYA